VGRHGEGFHNVAESFYGTAAWDCYWSLQDGNETVTWADAHLTATGVAQAQKAHKFWASQIKDQKIPTPESYYSSPLTRCMETAKNTFSGLDLPSRHPFVPTIKELFREAIGAHTCDRRSSKTAIHQNFPTYLFEEGFKEEDPLWDPLLRETDSAQDARSKIVLDDVFSSDDATYLSVSSHSGEIGSLLRVVGHRTFGLGTGQVIPVLVKAETVSGTAPTSTIAPWTTVTTCATPPPTQTPA
jgi:broad specificity phosphatase PhoE